LNKDEEITKTRFIISEVSKKFLLEGESFIVQKEHEHVREIMTLYAKQTNLLESVLLLSEANMNEEAIVLFRSQLNNYMLIEYLMNDTGNRKHYKDYMFQPVKSELSFLKNIQYAVRKGWIEAPVDLNTKIKEWKKTLKDNGYYDKSKNEYDTRPLSVAHLAKQSAILFGSYAQFYREGSQFEHSDPSSLEIYRTKFLEEYSNQLVFTMSLSRTDEKLGEKTIHWAKTIYGLSFIKVMQYLSKSYEHMIREEYKEDLAKLALFIKESTESE
jgi:hypothetical protein